MSANSFCLDFGEKYTRIVNAKMSGDKIELVNLGFFETVPNFFSADNESNIDKQSESIAKLADSFKLKEKDVEVIIPDSLTYSQIVAMPKLNEKELLSAIRYQADQFIPMPIDEVALDIEILSEDQKNNKLSILIVASPKKTVELVQKTLERAGVFPISLENELSALGRLFSEKYKPKSNGLILIVNLGYSSSSIYLVDGRTSLVLVTRTFKLGLNLFIKDLKVNLSIDEAKAVEALKTIGLTKNASYDIESIVAPLTNEISEEIKKFIVLAKGQYGLSPEKVMVYNHSPMIALFDKKIESMISIATVDLNLEGLIVNSPIYQSHLHEIPLYISAISGNLR